MTSNEQCVEIAGLIGWTNIRNVGTLVGTPPSGMPDCNIRRYNRDLNAMHQAEKSLNRAQQDHFLREIQIVVVDWSDETDERWFWNCMHATAEQRARAFWEVMKKETD